eukprot:m.165830 g.165830  ORF g.165830 m.165830 type:complete len:263 (+) comp18140_c0_seq10:1189-1977(+)
MRWRFRNWIGKIPTRGTRTGAALDARWDFCGTLCPSTRSQSRHWTKKNGKARRRRQGLHRCGGSVQCAPCSRVFIVFYKAHTNGQKHGYSTNQNVLHTAELWMDDYADVVRATLGPRALTAVGRDSAMARTLAASRTRVAQLQSRLQCKSFQWFLDNIYPENEITSLQDIKLLGNFRNEGDKNDSCLDTMARMDFGKPIGLYPCGGIDRLSQSFALLANHHIMPTQRMEMCLGTRLCDTSGTLRYCCRAKDPLLLWRDGLWL